MGCKLYQLKKTSVLLGVLAGAAFISSVTASSAIAAMATIATATDESLNEVNRANLLRLTPEQLVREVASRNAAIIYEQLQMQLAERQVDIEKAIFEPEFVASLMHQEIDMPNSVEESLSRSFQSQYKEDSLRFSTGVKGKVITGGEWSVTYNSKQTQSTVIDQFAAFDKEYRNTLQLQFKQPLLRDRGRNATLAGRKVADLARHIAFLTYRLRLMETSGSAIQAYWNYYRTQELLRHWQESQAIAERLYKDAQARAKRGLGAQTDVLEAETALATYTTHVIRARAELVESRNRIFSLLNITAEVDPDFTALAVHKPEQSRIEVPVFADSLQKALNNWPPYLIALEKVKSEKVQVNYSKNQLKPRLDLALGVDMVGLDEKNSEALSDSFDGRSSSWYVGLEYSMPIMGNRARKGELAQSKLRERQARLELSSVRRNLSNSLHSRLAQVANAEQKLVFHRRDLELKRRLRNAEMEKVQLGRSNMRELFRQEEELMDYQRRYLHAVVESRLAEAALDIAQGDLLARYDIDVALEEPGEAVNEMPQTAPESVPESAPVVAPTPTPETQSSEANLEENNALPDSSEVDGEEGEGEEGEEASVTDEATDLSQEPIDETNENQP